MHRRMGIVLAALGCVAMPMAAQTTPAPAAPQLVNVARVQVKPDRVAEWLELEKLYTAAFKKGGGTFRYVYRNNAGNPFEYMVVTGGGKYADLDGESFYAKGTTEAELARMQMRRNQCVDAVRTTWERTIPELAIAGPDNSIPKLLRMTRMTVRPDMADQFIALMKDEYVPMLKKGGVTRLLFRRVEWGGSRNQFTMSGRFEKFEELDAGSVSLKVLGKEGSAKLLSKVRQMTGSSEYLLYTYLPEQSYRASQ